MKKYEELKIEAICIEEVDIISTSNPFDSEEQPLSGNKGNTPVI